MELRIRPSSTVPICLDLGTDNQKFLDDPLYLGLRQKRVAEKEVTEFMDEFMREITAAFPKLLVQFEVQFFQSRSSKLTLKIVTVRTSPLTKPSDTWKSIVISIQFLMTTSKAPEP